MCPPARRLSAESRNACRECGARIEGVIYLVGPNYRRACEACVRQADLARQAYLHDRLGGTEEDFKPEEPWLPDPHPCEGCGLPLALNYWTRRRVHVCSRECEAERRNRRRRVTHEQRECQGCGVSFVPSRSDARYCSDACRQRAYRQRRGRKS